MEYKNEKHKLNCERWEFIRNFTKEEYGELGYKNPDSTRAWYKCKKCGEFKQIAKSQFKGHLLMCKNNCHVEVKIENEYHNFNIGNWEFIRNLTKKEYVESNYIPSGKEGGDTRAWYKCKKCGELKSMSKSRFKRSRTVCDNGCHGKSFNTNRVIIGVDDIATTHPYLTQYFVCREDAFKHRSGSGKKIKTKCPHCSHVKEIRVHDLVKYPYRCDLCDDGVSYPEKFLMRLFQELNIGFKKQIMLDTCHKYDFLVNDTIIEVHGEQHYKYTGFHRSFYEERENDMLKYDIAVLHGYEYNKNYIFIDARKSNLEWMRQSIIDANLLQILGFAEESVDWLKIEQGARSNLVKEVCNYFDSNNTSTLKMQEIFGLNFNTISRYLKQGAELGWCVYNPKDYDVTKRTKRVKGVHIISGEVLIFNSISEAGRKLRGERGMKNISRCCRGKGKSAYGYVWEYID